MKRYNGPRKGRSYSNAPTTYITRPRPSSKFVTCAWSDAATTRHHWTNQWLLRSLIPRLALVEDLEAFPTDCVPARCLGLR